MMYIFCGFHVERYGIVEFNVPRDTVEVISETGHVEREREFDLWNNCILI